MHKTRVLLVDDDQLTLRVLSAMLEEAGFESSCHQSPLDALGAVEQEHPDVIVADFLMPEMNGIAFLEMSVARSPESARIICTAFTDFSVAMHAVNTGRVHRILSKPPRQEEFVSAVRQAAETVRLRRENEELTATLRRQNLHLEDIVRERTEALLQGFVASLDARDSDTQSHSRRVARYTTLLASRVGITEPDLTIIERGALLHDIGKIGVPDRVLLKQGPLSDEEWVQMRKHPELGWALLQKVGYLRVAAPIVLQHHERWDGSGYPVGISGEQIVIGARVFQVVDAYDAITTDRPYRRQLPHGQACHALMKGSGTQFDPAVVKAFLSVPVNEWLRIRTEVDRACERDHFAAGDWRKTAAGLLAAVQRLGEAAGFRPGDGAFTEGREAPVAASLARPAGTDRS
jgi:putative nucleotidyltransferase with HDIG domain